MKKIAIILATVLMLSIMAVACNDKQEANTLVVSVNAAYEGEVDGVKTYKTINEALASFSTAKAIDKKIVKIAAGTYNEKIVISGNLKNVAFVGANVADTKIAYEIYTGNIDPTTNSNYSMKDAAVLSVLADGFSMKNIFVENTYDYNANVSVSQRQALALSASADGCVFSSCRFKSYQDTIYNQSGRQYFNNCKIEGAVDFMCAQNAPCYFENCDIVSLKRLKADGNVDSNGGYLAVTQGCDGVDDQNTVAYGYVYNNCRFTAEEGVLSGSVCLARPWRKNATVAFLNCEMGAHISKLAYNGANSKRRYVFMSGSVIPGTDPQEKRKNLPEEANFAEYNNTGDGAITASEYSANLALVDAANRNTDQSYTNDFKMLDETEAAAYTLQNVFAKTNGQITFATDFDAEACLTALNAL